MSLKILFSPLLERLGTVHGFTTRLGGVSINPYDSLNLHEEGPDFPHAVQTNLKRFAHAAGFAIESLVQLSQVHGDVIIPISTRAEKKIEGDGLFTKNNWVLSIKTADCLPILITDGQGMVAAIHAGWKGTILRIAEKAIALFLSRGKSPRDLYVAIGPGIQACCFEVSVDIATAFRAISTDLVVSKKGSLFVDLIQTNRYFLEGMGIPRSQIDSSFPCTFCDSDLFFSYRRDKGRTGRQMAFIKGGTRYFVKCSRTLDQESTCTTEERTA